MSVVLSEHLPLLATAPEGIQKLRGLILELAVRGKLVPQDPNDEPASELLKRIAKERARLEAAGVCKKSKAQAVRTEEQPFEAPHGWAWVRLTHFGEFRSGKTPSTNRSEYWDGTIPWVSPKDMKSLVVSKTEDYVSDLAISDGLSLIPASSVLVVVRSGILRRTVPVAINSQPCTVNQDLKALCLVLPDLAQYVQLLIRGFERLILETLTKVGTTVESVKFDEFSQQPFPLPPLPEQHRIIAKVDELIALCDRLEAEQSDAAAAHERLVATLLGTLTESTDAADLAANWQRLADHFDTLFTTEASLDALKQTILQLAVMGKLVPQDPNDAPASETFRGLERLSLAPEALMQPPDQWAVCQYRSLTSLITSGSRGWKEFYSDTGAVFIRTQNIKTDTLVLDDVAFVDLPKRAEGMRSQVLKDDILITITGANVTKAARIEMDLPEAYVSQHIALTRPTWSEMARWLHLCFVSRGSARGILEKLAYGDKPGLSLTNIRDLALPIPPLAEQHRIVAKVDELLALVERLKAELAESRTRQAQLADTLIETALAAA